MSPESSNLAKSFQRQNQDECCGDQIYSSHYKYQDWPMFQDENEMVFLETLKAFQYHQNWILLTKHE